MSHITPNGRLVIRNGSVKLFHLERLIRCQRIRVCHSWFNQARSFKASDRLIVFTLQRKRVARRYPGLWARTVDRHQVLGKLGELGPIIQVPEHGGEPFHVVNSVWLELSHPSKRPSCLFACIDLVIRSIFDSDSSGGNLPTRILPIRNKLVRRH